MLDGMLNGILNSILDGILNSILDGILNSMVDGILNSMVDGKSSVTFGSHVYQPSLQWPSSASPDCRGTSVHRTGTCGLPQPGTSTCAEACVDT